jgi:hypothetical protein
LLSTHKVYASLPGQSLKLSSKQADTDAHNQIDGRPFDFVELKRHPFGYRMPTWERSLIAPEVQALLPIQIKN